jgi:RNA polymerase sigma-70 factor (ECF subfamily)
VRSEAVAEEVVQDTWLAVVRGLHAFEGRSSLRTWIFSILVNRARTRAVREARSVPFSTLATEAEGPTVDPFRFGADDMWAAPPRRLATDPEERLLAQELRGELLAAVGALPDGQRAVIALRDLAGLRSEEVCELLDLTPGNQRVLLHRARARVRTALEANP